MLNIIMTQNRANELRAELSRAKKAALKAAGIQAVSYIRDITPVDTGRLRLSISNRLRGDSAIEIGTAVEYAVYVEMGTSRRSATPYLRPGIVDHAQEYCDIIKAYLEGRG